jgi:uncharacterized protein (TIGR02246 family)
MKTAKYLSVPLSVVFLFGSAPALLAQGLPTDASDRAAVTEVLALAKQRGAAGEKGDADAAVAMMAEDVQVTGSNTGFRIDGKAAMRAYVSNLWKNYPGHSLRTNQVKYRVYNHGQVVIINDYADVTFFDKLGKAYTEMQRQAQTWVKTDGKWQLVDVNNSRMPE